jgi:dTDP-4-dehydrorhamnose reductase
MHCHLLILGGNGKLVNSIIPFLPPNTVIAGRHMPESAGNYQFLKYDLHYDITIITDKLLYVDAILNCTAVVSCNCAANGFNNESIRTVASLCRHFHCRCIHISTLKCEPRRFLKGSQHRHPLSPYSWSKLCGELLLKDLWKNSSIIRLAFVEGPHHRAYYDKLLFVVNVIISTVTPLDVWNAITHEINEKGWRVIPAKTNEKRLVDFVKEQTGKKLIIPVPIRIFNWFLKRFPSKLFDYMM